MRYKLVIFDLDGTVLNTIGGLAHAVNHVLEANGLNIKTKAEVQAMVGNGTRKLIERSLGENADASLVDKVYAEYQQYYRENCSYDTYPYEGIVDMLRSLNEAGIRCAVVTNKPDAPAKKLINDNFGDLIAETHGNVPDVPVKPDPTFVRMTMENLKADPSQTVYIGDSDVDINTGKNAGIDFISVDWGFRTRDFLIENGAGIIFSDPASLASYIID